MDQISSNDFLINYINLSYAMACCLLSLSVLPRKTGNYPEMTEKLLAGK